MSSNTDVPDNYIKNQENFNHLDNKDEEMKDAEENSDQKILIEEGKRSEKLEFSEKITSPQTTLLNSHSNFDSTIPSNPTTNPSLLPSTEPNEGKFFINALNKKSIAADFSNLDELVVNSNSIKHEIINWNSRGIQINNNELLITGGKSNKSSLTMNIETEDITIHQDLIIGRSLHAMSWINNCPAVIGGIGENEQTLGSVEIYSQNTWKEIVPLNYPRYGHAATYHAEKTWVIGGAKNPREGEINIEIYQENKWIRIDIQLKTCIVGLGLFAKDEEIYVLGGFTLSKKNTSKVSALNITNHTLKKAKRLPEPACFTQNLWKSQDNTFETFAFKGPKIVYEVIT